MFYMTIQVFTDYCQGDDGKKCRLVCKYILFYTTFIKNKKVGVTMKKYTNFIVVAALLVVFSFGAVSLGINQGFVNECCVEISIRSFEPPVDCDEWF